MWASPFTSSASRRSITTARRPCCATARSSPLRQEERFTRKKGDADFPHRAVEFCLRQAGISVDDFDYVGFYDKPLLKFERILETYLGVAPAAFSSFLMAGPLWIKEKLYIDERCAIALGTTRASCSTPSTTNRTPPAPFFRRPFEEAAILTMDGVGEWATAHIGVRPRQRPRDPRARLRWPDSLGLLYSAFTYYTGFKVNSGEYKVMGLAPYGEPKYVDRIYKELIDLQRGRLVHAEPEVLQLPHRPDDDQRGVQRAVRRPAAPARIEADAEGDGPRPLGAGGVRRDHAAHGAHGAHARPAPRTCAWPAAWRSIASAMAACCAKDRSSASGSSRRPAMPAARSAWRN